MTESTWQKFKQDMKQNNAKFAAGQKANINQAKARTKEINAESAEHRASIKDSTAKHDGRSANKFLMILWGTILSAPLFVIGVILFIMAALLFWDMIFGL